TISWPGTIGYCEKPHSLRAMWMSLWQTPQYRMSMPTSWVPGSRRSMDSGASLAVADVAAYAATVGMGNTPLAERGAHAHHRIDVLIVTDEACVHCHQR